MAAALVEAGAVVYAVDHIGHGRSGGERVRVHDFEDVVTDLHALDEQARRDHPGLPVVLRGHSMGGLIAARYAQRYGDTLTALVLSSPVIGPLGGGDPAARHIRDPGRAARRHHVVARPACWRVHARRA